MQWDRWRDRRSPLPGRSRQSPAAARRRRCWRGPPRRRPCPGCSARRAGTGCYPGEPDGSARPAAAGPSPDRHQSPRSAWGSSPVSWSGKRWWRRPVTTLLPDQPLTDRLQKRGCRLASRRDHAEQRSDRRPPAPLPPPPTAGHLSSCRPGEPGTRRRLVPGSCRGG